MAPMTSKCSGTIERDSQFLLNRCPDSLVCSNASLKDNGREDLFSPADVVEIIPDQRVTEPGHNILNRMADLLLVDHVCLSKNRAPSCNPDRVIWP